MKRIFIEVSVIGIDDPVGKLRRMGIPEECIRVEDVSDPIADAVYAETGISIETIKSKDSTRDAVMARSIYIHHRKELGETNQAIANDIGRDGSSIRWYNHHYDESMQGDFIFKASALRCIARLKANPYWCPPEVLKFNTGKKKSKKRGVRNKKQKMIK